MNPQEVALSEIEQLTIERDAIAQEFADLQKTHRTTAQENARLKEEILWWIERAQRTTRPTWDEPF